MRANNPYTWSLQRIPQTLIFTSGPLYYSSSSMFDCLSPSTLSSGSHDLSSPWSFLLERLFTRLFYWCFSFPTFQIVFPPVFLSLCWLPLTYVTSSSLFYSVVCILNQDLVFLFHFLQDTYDHSFEFSAQESISLILFGWYYHQGCLGFSCFLCYWIGICASRVSSLSFFMSALFFQLKYFHVHLGLGCDGVEIHYSENSCLVLELRVLLMLY